MKEPIKPPMRMELAMNPLKALSVTPYSAEMKSRAYSRGEGGGDEEEEERWMETTIVRRGQEREVSVGKNGR